MPGLDAAVERALQLQLQQAPPFSEQALASVERLGVLRPVDITDLARLTNLRTLILVGYGGQDLSPLAGLPIVSLEIEVSAARGLEVIADLPTLRILRAKNNAISDIDVLNEGEHRFVEIDLTGNPLSDRGFREVVPQLHDRVPELRVSGEREWSLTRRLYAAGLPFDYYRDENGYWLCRPGLRYTDFPNADHLKIDPEEIEAILDRDPATIPAMFRNYES
ncbi:Leucine Rich repeats (2 copies) [Micromonospora sp. MW-13]|uniref:leucine-rich repeat domain-containing protein n=1 Tax=Micromonospora sp. MW-13 TaxID=2094022 RepID=UPI000E44A369|nr:leucine-rich repeat domain-containing protein [Micromonospora sp. MW-13]RGC65802.1 Leucine Rich repeats (2 copies) [Micromonospora sp. MW-13]